MPRRCSRNTFLSPSPPTRSSRACRWSYLVTPPTLRNSHSVRVSTSISGLAHVRSKRPFPSLITLRYTVLLRLGANVDWENEKPCFASFLRELAFFYSPSPSPVGAAQPQPPPPLPVPPPHPTTGQQTRPSRLRLGGSDRAGSTTHDRARPLPCGEAIPRRAGETAREGCCARDESRGAVSGV